LQREKEERRRNGKLGRNSFEFLKDRILVQVVVMIG
jgi:hypothetical protein